MTTLELLKAARARIERPEAWTQGSWARDADGHRCAENAPGAVRWCSLGAIQGPRQVVGDAEAALKDTLVDRGSSVAVSTFNDDPTRTHAEVLDLFDRTIARLEAAQ